MHLHAGESCAVVILLRHAGQVERSLRVAGQIRRLVPIELPEDFWRWDSSSAAGDFQRRSFQKENVGIRGTDGHGRLLKLGIVCRHGKLNFIVEPFF